MTSRYSLFVVVLFMLCSICLYVAMPKVLPRVGSEKSANRIFLVLWSIMTFTGISIATRALFD